MYALPMGGLEATPAVYIVSCKNPSYSVPFQFARLSPIPSPVLLMYPSIRGTVTCKGRVCVKDGTHMSSITVGVEVIGFDEGNEVDGWGDGFAVGLDDVGGDDGVEVGLEVGVFVGGATFNDVSSKVGVEEGFCVV
jgi:hypothetical protein